MVSPLGQRGACRARSARRAARRRMAVRRRADAGRHLPRPPALQCAPLRGAARPLSRRCAAPTRPPPRIPPSPPPTPMSRSKADEPRRRHDPRNGPGPRRGRRARAASDIPSLKGKVSAEEWAIRVDLAAAYRLVAYYGWDDLIFTHLSARIPGPEHHFLLNPYQLMFEEVTASSLVKVDVHGNPVDPTPFITNPAGFTIHSAVHMAREDAQAVMHLHTPAGQAVAAHEEGLLPLTQTAMLVRGDLAFHDYEGVAVDHDERARIVADLGHEGRDAAAQPRHARGRQQCRRMLREALFHRARMPGAGHGAVGGRPHQPSAAGRRRTRRRSRAGSGSRWPPICSPGPPCCARPTGSTRPSPTDRRA